MTVLTDFGDLAVLLPLAAVMLLWLLAQRQKRGFLGWALAVAFCIGATAVLKISFSVCSLSPALQSPSGHTSFSMLVYGGVALMVAVQSTGWQRLIALAAAGGLICGIAISRIVIGAHTPLEVALGVTIGSIAVAIFARSYFRDRPVELALRPLLVVLVLLAIVLNGQEVRAEELLHALGRYLHFDGASCA